MAVTVHDVADALHAHGRAHRTKTDLVPEHLGPLDRGDQLRGSLEEESRGLGGRRTTPLPLVLGATDGRAPAGFGPLAIGLTLTLIHLISIPISNTSVNPARSTAVAFFNGNGAPGQVWLFWLAPLLGGLIGGILYPLMFGNGKFALGRAPDDEPIAEPTRR